MPVKIGHASIDERGKITGGSAGDQTGKEVCERNWYKPTKTWGFVLRCKKADKREKIAEAMEKACANNDIGYDQNQRDTLWNNIKGAGWDPSKTTKKVETDCSALVRVCIAFAFGKDLVGNIRTVSMPSILSGTGEFEKLTDAKYTESSDYLLRGDILVTPSSGHTVVVLSDGAKVEPMTTNTKKEESCTVKMQTIKRGANGDQVKALQALLTGYGYDLGRSGVDGDFGGKTDEALRKYQADNGLAADGIAGPDTWAKLLGVS